jgi:regulator of ribonuclease activity A
LQYSLLGNHIPDMTPPSLVPTADLCDREGARALVAEPVFRDFGGHVAFAGPVATVRVRDDNLLVRQTLDTPGLGRVLVIDGGGSRRCALLGDNLAALAIDRGWAGVIVFGCVRDAAALATLPLGIKALATHPKRGDKMGVGDLDVPVTIAGITITPGAMLTADADGVVVTPIE